jgi:DNA mismatch endonuclease (patch repair protein)
MIDHVSKSKRTEIMRAVASKDTKPERIVRSAAHRLGLRFRLHKKELPGKPDLVFPKWKIAAFVHGCFWHRHSRCKKTTTPKTNTAFWKEKFRKNVVRDKKNIEELERLGWRVIVIWQCQLKDIDAAMNLLAEKFDLPAESHENEHTS